MRGPIGTLIPEADRDDPDPTAKLSNADGTSSRASAPDDYLDGRFQTAQQASWPTDMPTRSPYLFLILRPLGASVLYTPRVTALRLPLYFARNLKSRMYISPSF